MAVSFRNPSVLFWYRLTCLLLPRRALLTRAQTPPAQQTSSAARGLLLCVKHLPDAQMLSPPKSDSDAKSCRLPGEVRWVTQTTPPPPRRNRTAALRKIASTQPKRKIVTHDKWHLTNVWHIVIHSNAFVPRTACQKFTLFDSAIVPWECSKSLYSKRS